MRRALGMAVFSGMLGVTLFGIFLTPVFFYVIEGLAETPLFASDNMRLVGRVMRYVLGVLTLGVPWLLILLGGGKLRRQVAAERPTPSANGHGNENGAAGNGHVPLGDPTDAPDDDPDRILTR